MKDRKNIAFIFIILLFFTSIASANDSNIIFLKAGHINTDLETDVNNTGPSTMAVSVNNEVPDSSYKYYLVQFDGIVQPEWKDTVETTGAEIFDYVPDNTFVLKMNETVKSQVESLEFVRWIGEYLPVYKYVAEETDSFSNSTNSTIELLVTLFEAENDEQIIEEINQIDGTIIDNSYQILKIEIPVNNIEELTKINGISWIEEYHTPTAFNDVAATIMNVSIVHSNVGLNGSGQIVAVCDTGLDTGVDDETMHADIRGRILKIIDYSDNGAMDYAGHGTHVVGSVLGNGSMSGGQYKGIAPEASLVFQAVQNATDSTNELSAIPGNLSILFQSAYNLTAKIHSNSWGDGDYGKYTTSSQQVDDFIWNNPDMVIVFAAGNSGPSIYSISSPATAKNCITVGASESNRTGVKDFLGYSYDSYTDNIDEVATFSSRGPTVDNRIKPDVVAPGTCIISTRSSLATYEYINISQNTNYAYLSGTSMATPLVSGSIALIREYYLTEEKLENVSAALLKATLINGAYDISQETEAQYDYSQGWGRVDVANSIMVNYPEVIAYYDGKSLSKNESWTHTYEYIENGESLRATLVWTDYPAFEGTTKSLVNDLDFTITDSSDTYYGNGGSDFDRINNVEGIELSSVSDEDYTFNITAHSVNKGGSQPFALVASFTCDNNEFPAPGTQATSKNMAVSTDVVHPQGVDYDSIVMKINNSTVSFTATPITDGYRIEYNSASSYQTGEYNISISASTENGQDFSYSWNFTVDAVTSNNAPVLSHIGTRNVSESSTLIINLSATDADNDTLIFGTNASFGVLYDNTFTWTPDYNDSGVYSVEFNVTDGIEVDNETITINVTNINLPPEFDSISSKTIEVTKNLQFTINATDADGDELVYSNVSTLPDGATFNATSLLFNWTPTVDQKGTYFVNFTVTDGNDYSNLTVPIIVIELSTITKTPSGGGGGGGGGGTTGEDVENIAVKDVSSVFVGIGNVKFDFYRDGNDIQYIGYESLKNSGTISVTIEVLKDKSTFVYSLPAGDVYKNINIWVGKAGYATEDNIADPVIGFKVSRNWIEDNDIDELSIVLERYDGGWSRLSTTQTGSDDEYLYFEASTPGFSPFVIIGEANERLQSVTDEDNSAIDTLNSSINASTEVVTPEKTIGALSALTCGLIIALVCFLYRKQ
ncbi:PGF-pre-PGF domain-containing protein [Methanolobus sediminis]|uniref:PGF-pre-PGF domain-containing protein n=1 Tax=Methanolobus sediminis TaxID=3072978 RepID=A0AA51UL03_9EURY|nr:PGF-pre-PGF domain-containing protein [Methanolobus sediminis]WMW25506.1 PGF-pre-PGF domain-containing protein [Methanolobus sediminis]